MILFYQFNFSPRDLLSKHLPERALFSLSQHFRSVYLINGFSSSYVYHGQEKHARETPRLLPACIHHQPTPRSTWKRITRRREFFTRSPPLAQATHQQWVDWWWLTIVVVGGQDEWNIYTQSGRVNLCPEIYLLRLGVLRADAQVFNDDRAKRTSHGAVAFRTRGIFLPRPRSNRRMLWIWQSRGEEPCVFCVCIGGSLKFAPGRLLGRFVWVCFWPVRIPAGMPGTDESKSFVQQQRVQPGHLDPFLRPDAATGIFQIWREVRFEFHEQRTIIHFRCQQFLIQFQMLKLSW